MDNFINEIQCFLESLVGSIFEFINETLGSVFGFELDAPDFGCDE